MPPAPTSATSDRARNSARRTFLAAAVVASLAIVLLTASRTAAASGRSVSRAAAPAAAAAAAPMYAVYYLWWSTNHWHTKLGLNYPYAQRPAPLPATLAADGCHPVSSYKGNTLSDVSPTLVSQDDPGAIAADVKTAAAAGLSGFAVNWAGSGTTTQGVTANPYNARLDVLVKAVAAIRATGVKFSLWLSYMGSASMKTPTAIVNDMNYLYRSYGTSPVWDRSKSPRLTFVWTGSRKYSLSALASVSTAERSRYFIVGDENWGTWTASRATYLDGDQYYWSSQNPYNNANSFAQLAALASTVRASGSNPDGSAKVWFAPLAPGFDTILSGGSACTPRNNGQTLRLLYTGNARSNPDGWVVISWNEITEGTYVMPLARYGMTYLNALRAIATGS